MCRRETYKQKRINSFIYAQTDTAFTQRGAAILQFLLWGLFFGLPCRKKSPGRMHKSKHLFLWGLLKMTLFDE